MKDYPTSISTSFDHSLSGSEPPSNSAADQSRKLEQLRDDEFWEYARKIAELTPVVLYSTASTSATIFIRFFDKLNPTVLPPTFNTDFPNAILCFTLVFAV